MYSPTPSAAAPGGMKALAWCMNRGNRRNPDRMAVQAHRMTTLRRGPWPNCSSRWWMCFLSGVWKLVPWAVRRMKAKVMSTMGTPRMKNGMKSGAKKK